MRRLKLKRLVPVHPITTVQEMGWTSRSDRDVLALSAAAGFDGVITVDRNLPFQQRTGRLPLAVTVLRGRSSRLADLAALVPKLLAACDTRASGTVVTIEPDPPRSR